MTVGVVDASRSRPGRLADLEREPEGIEGRTYRGGREDALSGGMSGRAGGGGFYRLEVKVHGRAGQASAVAAAAYRSASALGTPGEDGFDFSAKRGVVHSEVVLPDGAPERLGDRGTLWREVERVERRCDAQLFREVILALPRELEREARVALVVGFVREQFVERGMVADVSVHEVRGTGGKLAPHAHVMLTLRAVGPEGFGLKERGWNERALLVEWREAWAASVNFALAEHGIEGRVSHESLAVRLGRALASGDFAAAAEVDHAPETKVGRAAFALARRGVVVGKVEGLEAERAERAEGRRLYGVVGEFGEGARSRFLELRAGCRDVFEAFVAWGEEQAASLSALARGAVVAGAVGAVAVGGGLARDTPQPLTPPLEWQGTGGGTDVGSGPPGAVPETRGTTMSDEELDRMIGEMMVEDRAAVVAEAQAAEREEEAQAPAAAPAAAWSMALSGGDRSAEEEARAEVESAEAWEIGVTAGDWPAAVSDAELEGMEREEKELEAEQAAEGREGEAGDRESAEASGDEPEEQQAGEGEVEEDDPELDKLIEGLDEPGDRAVSERAIGEAELEAGD